MRLRSYLKGLFIFGLLLFLGVSLPCNNMRTAYADETQDIKLNVNSQTIVRGKTFTLYVYNLFEDQEVSFVSSDPAVASVDEYGVVTGNLIGTATILVTVTEGENTVDILSCDIKVGLPAVNVRFSRLELAMKVGQKLTLERIVLPLNAVESPKFSSYNRKIATVSAGGRVTARAEGSTYIFAQLDNGRFAVCKVNIYPVDIPDELFEAYVKETMKTIIIPTEALITGVPAEEAPLLDPVNADFFGEDLLAPMALEEGFEENFEENLEENFEEPSEESFEDIFAEEQARLEISDPFLIHSDDMDFETFIKKLNAALKSSESAESELDNAN